MVLHTSPPLHQQTALLLSSPPPTDGSSTAINSPPQLSSPPPANGIINNPANSSSTAIDGPPHLSFPSNSSSTVVNSPHLSHPSPCDKSHPLSPATSCKCQTGCTAKKNCQCNRNGQECSSACHPGRGCMNISMAPMTESIDVDHVPTTENPPNTWLEVAGIRLTTKHSQIMDSVAWVDDSIISAKTHMLAHFNCCFWPQQWLLSPKARNLCRF